ncbi:hypothetical protein L798_11445 [Zootermopsis nevadensis]|uniref:Uncharacterized protein n=1 Tax=Zootermopsis nevadensis TaxID=136037 RepID=A0A067QWB6_ZOONE|nr:hypothetical protein L798_11445 [Zootermopsis nevadensis]
MHRKGHGGHEFTAVTKTDATPVKIKNCHWPHGYVPLLCLHFDK